MSDFNNVRAHAKSRGLVLKKNGTGYKVNYPRGTDATAFFCATLDDVPKAVRLMSQMVEKRL